MPSDALSVVVCDAGPIIHLDELRSLDLLRAFQEILVPYPVWEEVQRHRPSALRRRKFLLKRVDDMPEPTPELLRLRSIQQKSTLHLAPGFLNQVIERVRESTP